MHGTAPAPGKSRCARPGRAEPSRAEPACAPRGAAHVWLRSRLELGSSEAAAASPPRPFLLSPPRCSPPCGARYPSGRAARAAHSAPSRPVPSGGRSCGAPRRRSGPRAKRCSLCRGCRASSPTFTARRDAAARPAPLSRGGCGFPAPALLAPTPALPSGNGGGAGCQHRDVRAPTERSAPRPRRSCPKGRAPLQPQPSFAESPDRADGQTDGSAPQPPGHGESPAPSGPESPVRGNGTGLDGAAPAGASAGGSRRPRGPRRCPRPGARGTEPAPGRRRPRGAAGRAGGGCPGPGRRGRGRGPAGCGAPTPRGSALLLPAPGLTRPAGGQEAQLGAPGVASGRLRHEGQPRGAQAGRGSAAPDGSGVRGIPHCADSLSLDLREKCSIKIQFGAFRLPPSLSPPSLFPSPPVADVAAVNHGPTDQLWPAPPGPARSPRPRPRAHRRPGPEPGTGPGQRQPGPRAPGPSRGLPGLLGARRRAGPPVAGRPRGRGTPPAPPRPLLPAPTGPALPGCRGNRERAGGCSPAAGSGGLGGRRPRCEGPEERAGSCGTPGGTGTARRGLRMRGAARRGPARPGPVRGGCAWGEVGGLGLSPRCCRSGSCAATCPAGPAGGCGLLFGCGRPRPTAGRWGGEHGAPSSAGAGRKLRAPSRGGQERGGRRQSGGEARAAPGGAAPR
ncbi:collagen alpha-1(I) chain-like [Anser cygnoides]|uniref:collagen alpha-1(I) chain-like n=1 Tax=Anser cygnoides TaxID=8845 RepID=UPI0034D16321